MASLGGENREEFLQGCNGWYKSDKGQDMPCRIIEPSCQGGQSALVRFWCKEKTVPWSKLTQVVAAEGHAVGRTEKQKQNKAQLDKLQGQAASAAAMAFHEECDRHYTSKAGTVTPCKMLSSKSGRSEVMFANGRASVCSAQLSWRQAPAAAKRSEQQAREQQAKKQATVEASATVQRQRERQRTALLEQASAVQVTEAEVSAVLHDPRYRQAGLTKGAAQQIAQMKRDSSRAHQERRQGEEQYQTALVEKGKEQMEGWEQEVADEGNKATKMRQLGLAWEAVLAPSVTGKPLSAKKAAGRVRCLAEQTARAAGTTMAAAVGAVINTEVVNWQHGVQCIREQAQPSKKSLVAAVADLAEQLSTGAQCEAQLGEVLCASVARSHQAEALRQKQESAGSVLCRGCGGATTAGLHAQGHCRHRATEGQQRQRTRYGWWKQGQSRSRSSWRRQQRRPSPGCKACRSRPGRLYRQGRGCQGKRANEACGSRGNRTHGE